MADKPTPIDPIDNEDTVTVVMPRRLVEWAAGTRQSYGSGYRHVALACQKALENVDES
jgi:hypothetical protein